MVEREQEGLRTLERCPAGLAAESLAVAADLGRAPVPQELHHRLAAALAEGLLERAGQPRLDVRPQREPVEHDLDGLPAGEIQLGQRGQRDDVSAYPDSREPARHQAGEQVRDPVGGRHR